MGAVAALLNAIGCVLILIILIAATYGGVTPAFGHGFIGALAFIGCVGNVLAFIADA